MPQYKSAERGVLERCLETRRRDGYTWRRYRGKDGGIYRTVEIPLPVFNALTRVGRGRDRIEAARRSQKRLEERVEVLRLAREGWKAIAISEATGVNLRTVYRWIAAATVIDPRRASVQTK